MNAKKDENGRPTIICASSSDGVTIIPIQANPVGHGIVYDDNTTGSDNGNNNGKAVLDENGVSVMIAESSDGSGNLIEVYGDANTGKILIDSQ